MNNRLKELIFSLKDSSVNPENEKKLKKLVSILEKKMDNIRTDDNWAAKKVIEILCMMREIMQDKNKSFKLFCKKLNPTKIELEDWVKPLFFGEEKIQPKNKMKSGR